MVQPGIQILIGDDFGIRIEAVTDLRLPIQLHRRTLGEIECAGDIENVGNEARFLLIRIT